MRAFLGIIFSLFILAPAFALNTDSIEAVAEHNQDALQRFKASVYLARIYTRQYPEKADYYLDKALAIAESEDDDSLRALTYFRRANLEKRLQNFETSKSYFYKAAELSQKNKNYRIFASVANNFGLMYSILSDYDSALYFLRESLRVKEKILEEDTTNRHNIQMVGKAHLNLGSIYLNKADYESSIRELFNSLRYFEQINDSVSIISTHINLGVIYYYYGKLGLAEKQYKLVLRLPALEHNKAKKASVLNNLAGVYISREEFGRADSIYQEVLKIRLDIGPRRSLAGVYDNLGVVAGNRGDYDKAIFYSLKALQIRKEINDLNGVISSYVNLGNLYMKQGQKKQAKKYFLLAVAADTGQTSSEVKVELFRNLSVLFEEEQNWKKALEYYRKYTRLDDSIHSIQSESIVNDLREKYNTAEKDKEILNYKRLQQINKLTQEKQQFRIRFLGAGIALLLAISAVIVLYINNRRKMEKALYEKNREIQRQKMLDLIKQQESHSINSFVKGQEKERARIAADLHDRLGSLLSTVKLHFSSLEPELENNEELHENFVYAVSLLDKSVQEVRAVSHNLAKEILIEFGLAGAVENLCDAINQAGGSMKVSFINSGYESTLPYKVEIEIYRMIQELVTNAVKHSQASELTIQFVKHDNELNITVEDDGVGFDMDKVESQSEGMGLNNMSQRATKINGTFNYDSRPSQGASFMIRIDTTPYEEEQN